MLSLFLQSRFLGKTRRSKKLSKRAARVNREPLSFKPPSDVKIMEIGFNDDNSKHAWYALTSKLKDVFIAIDAALAQNKRVLVSYSMGISRSATTVLAYLMYCFRLTFDQAYSFLYTKRQINPLDNFVIGLKAYEKRLFLSKFLFK